MISINWNKLFVYFIFISKCCLNQHAKDILHPSCRNSAKKWSIKGELIRKLIIINLTNLCLITKANRLKPEVKQSRLKMVLKLKKQGLALQPKVKGRQIVQWRKKPKEMLLLPILTKMTEPIHLMMRLCKINRSQSTHQSRPGLKWLKSRWIRKRTSWAKERALK